MLKKILAFCLGIILISSLAPIQTESQQITQNRGLIVTPAIIEAELDPGSSNIFNITLENDTPNQTYNLFPRIQTFKEGDREGSAILEELSTADPIYKWISFSEKSINLQPKAKKDISVSVNLPVGAKAGGYYLALVFSTKNPSETSETKINLDQAVATLLFLQVKGVIQRQATFDKVQINSKQGFITNLMQNLGFSDTCCVYDPFFDPIELSYQIKVEGNTHLKPEGNILIYENAERPQSTIDINPNNKIILPDSKRSFGLMLKSSLLSANFINNLAFADNIYDSTEEVYTPIIGMQNLDLKFVYTNSSSELETQNLGFKYILFPWKTLTLLLLVLASSGLLIFGVKKFKLKK